MSFIKLKDSLFDPNNRTVHKLKKEFMDFLHEIFKDVKTPVFKSYKVIRNKVLILEDVVKEALTSKGKKYLKKDGSIQYGKMEEKKPEKEEKVTKTEKAEKKENTEKKENKSGGKRKK